MGAAVIVCEPLPVDVDEELVDDEVLLPVDELLAVLPVPVVLLDPVLLDPVPVLAVDEPVELVEEPVPVVELPLALELPVDAFEADVVVSVEAVVADVVGAAPADWVAVLALAPGVVELPVASVAELDAEFVAVWATFESSLAIPQPDSNTAVAINVANDFLIVIERGPHA